MTEVDTAAMRIRTWLADLGTRNTYPPGGRLTDDVAAVLDALDDSRERLAYEREEVASLMGTQPPDPDHLRAVNFALGWGTSQISLAADALDAARSEVAERRAQNLATDHDAFAELQAERDAARAETAAVREELAAAKEIISAGRLAAGYREQVARAEAAEARVAELDDRLTRANSERHRQHDRADRAWADLAVARADADARWAERNGRILDLANQLEAARAAIGRVEALCDEETGDCHTIPCARCEFASAVRAALSPPAPTAAPTHAYLEPENDFGFCAFVDEGGRCNGAVEHPIHDFAVRLETVTPGTAALVERATRHVPNVTELRPEFEDDAAGSPAPSAATIPGYATGGNIEPMPNPYAAAGRGTADQPAADDHEQALRDLFLADALAGGTADPAAANADVDNVEQTWATRQDIAADPAHALTQIRMLCTEIRTLRAAVAGTADGEPPAAAGRVHELKTWPESFAAILDRRKTFEVRRADRGFVAGDQLRLREWSPYPLTGSGDYTGRETTVRVTYVLSLQPFIGLDYVAMSITVGRADGEPEPAAVVDDPQAWLSRVTARLSAAAALGITCGRPGCPRRPDVIHVALLCADHGPAADEPAPAAREDLLIDVVQTFPASINSTATYGCRRCGRQAYAVRRAVGELVCWLHSGTNSNLCLPDEIAAGGARTTEPEPAADEVPADLLVAESEVRELRAELLGLRADIWRQCAAWVQRMAQNTSAEIAVTRVAGFNPYAAEDERAAAAAGSAAPTPRSVPPEGETEAAARHLATLGTITHASPTGDEGLTPCCGRTPFDLPRIDRIATVDHPGWITCTGTP